MTELLLDSALRALALALAVWAGLRIFRVRNVPAEKAAWTVILAAALLMPLRLPLTARWPTATLVLPAIAARPAAASAEPAPATVTPQFNADAAASVPERSHAAGPGDRFPAPAISDSAPGIASAQPTTELMPECLQLSPAAFAMLLYLAVAGALLFRLLYGLATALRIWCAAEPVSFDRSGLALRCSRAVSSPVTIGSAIILPADYAEWDQEKLRIVLAHERSHIRQGDFYLQLLAGLYAAVVWFSPLGWWLKRKLSELGEAISDRSGLEQAKSRSSYAQVLLEFAAAPRLTPIGVAMARPSSLSRRIERLLNDRAFGQAFAGGRRAFVAAVVVPAALFAASALLRVQAASQAAQQAPIAGQSHPDAAPITMAPASAPDAAQAPPQNEPAPAAAPKAASGLGSGLAAKDKPGAPTHVDIPAIHINVPAVHVNIPATQINGPAVHVNVPAMHINVPAVHVNMPAQHIDIPAIHIDVPSAGAQNTSGSLNSFGSGGELLAMLSGMGHALVRPAPAQTEATFDRTLTFSGKLDLHVMNAAGDIHLTRGPANQVVIHAQVHSQYASDADEVHAIAANPPIEQNGNTIRIGGGPYREGTNHISIEYEIEAPADAVLEAMSSSGNIGDEGVGVGAKLQTGSGNIVARGLEGGFKAESGSGNITVENTGEGDAKAQTGSGSIVINGVHGSLKAQTGSGGISAAGIPSADWKLQTGSGNIELATGNAPMTLDASVGSGTISTAQQMVIQTSSERHHVHAELNGGGPEVRVETGSGDIHVQ